MASTAVIAVLVGCSAAPAPVPTGNDIDDLVAGSGNIDTTLTPGLVQTSQPTVKVVPDATANGGAGWACTETGYSLTNEPSKFVVVNPNADVMWPGSLVQGKSLAGGLLDPIPVKRAPGTITLTIAGGASSSFSQTMPEASLSNATQAMNTILAGYNGGTPAKFSYLSESVYSTEQLKVSVDANVSSETWSASGSLTFDSSTTKSHYLIKFSQEYFTMAFQPPDRRTARDSCW
jgi:thiol-activated cytolysin